MVTRILGIVVLLLVYVIGFAHGVYFTSRASHFPAIAPLVFQRDVPLTITPAASASATVQPTMRVTVVPTKKLLSIPPVSVSPTK